MQWVWVVMLLGVSAVFALPRPEVMHLEQVALLPKVLRETSGLIDYRGLLWTQVDSDSTTLYGIDAKNGAIKKTIHVLHARNRDWEALSQNDDAIFIADIGNNAGKRGEVQIYRINKRTLGCLDRSSSCRVKAHQVRIHYPHFQPSRDWYWHPYDAEAMDVDGKAITLFNKNWQNPSWVLRYTLSVEPGFQPMTEVAPLPVMMLVTGASRYHEQLWLVGYKVTLNGLQPYVMKFQQKHGQWVPSKTWKLDQLAQIESIAVVGGDTLYFTCEQDDFHKAALFRATVE